MKTPFEKLTDLLGTMPGYAVEVGAADGKHESPTLALEWNYGWKVLCIEPNPLFAAIARTHRFIVDECAATDFDANDVPFTICNVDPSCKRHEMQGGSSLAVDTELLSRYGWAPKGMIGIFVKARTINTLLKEHEFPRLDFISIDTEGTEDSVLRGLDIARWRPRVICVENWPGVNKTDHILLPLGYKRIARVMGNYTDWYLHG